MAMDTRCLSVTVRNISGSEKHFGCLGPHGRTLDAFESYSFFWDVFSGLSTKRKLTALQNSLAAGHLELVSTPSPFLLDQVTHITRRLQISNNALDLDEPCYESSEA